MKLPQDLAMLQHEPRHSTTVDERRRQVGASAVVRVQERSRAWHRSRDDHVVRPHTPSSAPKEPAQPFHVGIELTQILTRTTARCRKTNIICTIDPASWSATVSSLTMQV
ncbi:hypothetical protein PsorP6_005273 [Peronosclerospora sorghi]|uniref:Uncharacterized protein n=1 Tax=Peronosclerospora sorghi TaxID=230839 RepID=A0ACC0W5E3_9STRA|nr:hypothetical protein PsorP6_005273 [Peronosclerospora sorghi]